MIEAMSRMTKGPTVGTLLADVRKLLREPVLAVNLMHERTNENDPFYSRLTREFYRDARRRHPKLPLVRRFCHGVAVCVLPDSFDGYFMSIEAAARRNFKKASRSGFTFAPIRHNDFLEDIGRIRQSTEYRQGKVPDTHFEPVGPNNNPDTRTPYHDYPYFGILRDGRLFAYSACFVAGEICMIEHILGDAAARSAAVVPMLIISTVRYVMQNYPAVRYYSYGSYFGAGEEMRRFKRKFLFLPHRVTWQLGNSA